MTRFWTGLLIGAIFLCAGLTQGFAQSPAAPSSSAAGSPAVIPFKREPAAVSETAYRTGAALLVCLAVGALAVYVLRSRKPGSLLLPTAGKLKILETRRVGAKSMLLVVQWNAEELLLSHGDGGTTLLARAPVIPTPASGNPGSREPS